MTVAKRASETVHSPNWTAGKTVVPAPTLPTSGSKA